MLYKQQQSFAKWSQSEAQSSIFHLWLPNIILIEIAFKILHCNFEKKRSKVSGKHMIIIFSFLLLQTL